MGTTNRAVIPTIHTMPQLTGLAIAVAVSGFVPNAVLSRPTCDANEQMGYVSGSETTCDDVRSGYYPQNNFLNFFNRPYKCTCFDGFVRNSGGSCVPKHSCCGANEAFKIGIKSQETTCATLGQYNYRGFGGRYACFCADGFVRSPTGECVSVVSCGGTISCKQNEVLRVDFLPEPTCSMQYQPKSEQSHECYCLGDYIRQYRDGPCIHKSRCPPYNNQYQSQWQPQAYVPRTVPVNNQYLQPQAYTPNNLWSGGYG